MRSLAILPPGCRSRLGDTRAGSAPDIVESPYASQETYWRIPSCLHFDTLRRKRELIVQAVNKELGGAADDSGDAASPEQPRALKRSRGAGATADSSAPADADATADAGARDGPAALDGKFAPRLLFLAMWASEL